MLNVWTIFWRLYIYFGDYTAYMVQGVTFEMFLCGFVLSLVYSSLFFHLKYPKSKLSILPDLQFQNIC